MQPGGRDKAPRPGEDPHHRGDTSEGTMRRGAPRGWWGSSWVCPAQAGEVGIEQQFGRQGPLAKGRTGHVGRSDLVLRALGSVQQQLTPFIPSPSDLSLGGRYAQGQYTDISSPDFKALNYT